MQPKSMMEKVRVRRPRPPEATPKERTAWNSFLKMVDELQGAGSELNPMLRSELDRLVSKGNPIAIRFKERLAISSFRPRTNEEEPKAPPMPRRISRLHWGTPTKKKEVGGI